MLLSLLAATLCCSPGAAAPQGEDRPKKLVDAVSFPSAEQVKEWTAKGDEHKRVLDVVLKRDHWIAAVRAIEERLGAMGDWTLEVKLSAWDSSHPAHGHREGTKAEILFNMRRLGEYERKMDEHRRRQEALAKEGKRMVWRVPPIRYERLIWHELAHVFQGEVATPDWFHEGLASWIGDDSCYLYDFAVANKEVADVDARLTRDEDPYGRGQFFMKWLDSKIGREGMKKVAKAVYADRTDWKKALTEATSLEWDALKKAELDATRTAAAKLRP
jgi:hypothetical protein